MRSGEVRLCSWLGLDPEARFGAGGAAERPSGWTPTTNERVSVPIDVRFFGVLRDLKPTTCVYVNPSGNAFAVRHFMVSNVDQ
jgi:hypothetical protein